MKNNLHLIILKILLVSFGISKFDDSNYEESVFWILIYINNKMNWREVYRTGMRKTLDLCQYFKKIMEVKIPSIKNKIEEYGLDIQMCFDQAFITLLLYYCPLNFSKKILDMFLLSKKKTIKIKGIQNSFLVGERIIFEILIRIMKFSEKEILEAKSEEVEFYFYF